MATKAFIGPLTPTPDSSTPPAAIVMESYVVINSANQVLYVPDYSAISPPITVSLNYSDSLLAIQHKVLQGIRDAYEDQTIQGVFLNGLGGILNL